MFSFLFSDLFFTSQFILSSCMLACGLFFLYQRRERFLSRLDITQQMLISYKKQLSPIILTNEANKIIWLNKPASEFVGLKKRDSFGENHIHDGLFEASNLSLFEVESQDVRIGDKSLQLYHFSQNKSEKKVTSKTTQATSAEMIYQEYDHLFATAQIPFEFEGDLSSLKLNKNEKRLFSKLIYLSYYIAEDARNSSVKIESELKVRSQQLSIDIKGVKVEELEFYQDVYFSGEPETSLSEQWKTIEASLRNRNARLGVFNTSNGLTISLTMDSNIIRSVPVETN